MQYNGQFVIIMYSILGKKIFCYCSRGGGADFKKLFSCFPFEKIENVHYLPNFETTQELLLSVI